MHISGLKHYVGDNTDRSYKGYLQDIRITQLALYNDNFDVPTKLRDSSVFEPNLLRVMSLN